MRPAAGGGRAARAAALLCLLLALPALLAACGRQEPSAITVEDARLRILPTGGMGAAYFTLVNGGGPDRLVAVIAESPMLAGVHESRQEKGIVRMIARDSVPVPAHGRLTFAPGGLHVMLSHIPQPPPPAVKLTLRFQRHPDIMMTIPLSPSGGRKDHGH